MATIATVISVTGKVFAYNPVTRVGRLLKEGDTIERDEIVRSSDGAEISLKTQDGKFLGFGGEQAVQLDDSVSPAAGTPKIATEDGSLRPESIIAALNRGDDLSLSLEATAAGLGGGGGQGNGGFVRLLRIAENVDPLAFQYDTALLPGLPGLQSDATPIDDVTVQIYALVDGKLYKLSEVPEGAEATYVVYLTDTLTGQIIDNARGTVQITFTNGTAGSDDYSSTTITVALGEQFTADMLEDDLVEGPETFTVNASNYNNPSSYAVVRYGNEVETTILNTTVPTVTVSTFDPENPPENLPTDVNFNPDNEALGSIVREGSYAYFQVDYDLKGANSGSITLAFSNGPDSPPSSNEDFNEGANDAIEFEYWNGTNWVRYTDPVDVLDGGDPIYVRVQTFIDTVDEGDSIEQFTLTASLAYAESVTPVVDDAQGGIYENPDPTITVNTFDPENPPENLPTDDDFNPGNEALGSIVREGSYAYFQVKYDLDGADSGSITLAFSNVTTDDEDFDDVVDDDIQFEYWDYVEGNWVTYETPVAVVDGGDPIYVRVKTVIDAVDESAFDEYFTLTATLDYEYDGKDGTPVVDDAQGTIWEPGATTSDNYKTFEASTTTINAAIGVLVNDEGNPAAVLWIADNADGTDREPADGSATLTTVLGGTVKMNANGSFTYEVGPIDHDEVSQDSFWYAVDLGAGLIWTQVTIDIADTKPDALDDWLEVDLVQYPTPNTFVSTDSLLANDVIGADETTITNVWFIDGDGVKQYGVWNEDEGYWEVEGRYGYLYVNTDGTYTYAVDGDKLLSLDYEGAAGSLRGIAAPIISEENGQKSFYIADLGISGTKTGNWGFEDIVGSLEDSLDKQFNVSTSGDNDFVVFYDKGSQEKIGYGVAEPGDKGSSALAIGVGDVMIIDLGAPTSADIGINYAQGNQGNGYWVLYDADGYMLAYGELITDTNNGSLFDSVIRVQDSLEEGEEASYLVLGGYSSSQGFLIEEIAILTNDVETFGYEITDADGDTDTATLTISPDANDEPEAGSGSDALSSEDLVDAVETVLDAPDVSVTIESEPETNTAVIDVDWDNTDGAEQTITFDSLTEVQLRSALEEEPPTNP